MVLFIFSLLDIIFLSYHFNLTVSYFSKVFKESLLLIFMRLSGRQKHVRRIKRIAISLAIPLGAIACYGIDRAHQNFTQYLDDRAAQQRAYFDSMPSEVREKIERERALEFEYLGGLRSPDGLYHDINSKDFNKDNPN